MLKAELIKRSPLRILEKSTHGGVGKGNIGVIAAKKGIGKTACLVHLATDQLFQGKHIIHVSFASSTQHIIAWYEDIFSEISRRKKLADAMDIHDEIIRRRVIMNFNQNGVTTGQVTRSIRSMIRDGAFAADCIIIDGYDFRKSTVEDLKGIKDFAEELGLEIWFSATLQDDELPAGKGEVPEVLQPYLDHISIVIILKPEKGLIRLELLKDHDIRSIGDLHLKLDPKILLILEEDEAVTV
ncbi:MAG: hypothetical protein JW969_12060 [Spirochaetales bacterium]|nr:hypothetical protein [Spirochaetales bacterium]